MVASRRTTGQLMAQVVQDCTELILLLADMTLVVVLCSGISRRWISRQVAPCGDALTNAPQPHFPPFPPFSQKCFYGKMGWGVFSWGHRMPTLDPHTRASAGGHAWAVTGPFIATYQTISTKVPSTSTRTSTGKSTGEAKHNI